MSYLTRVEDLRKSIRSSLSIPIEKIEKEKSYYILMLKGGYLEKSPLVLLRTVNKYQKVIYTGYFAKYNWHVFTNYRNSRLKLLPKQYGIYWFLYPITTNKKTMKRLYEDSN